MWSVGAVECTGGYDPAYTGPNNSHVRPKCDCFEECGRIVRARVVAPTPVQAHQQQNRPVIPTYAPPAQQYAPAKVPIIGGQPPQPLAVRPPQAPVVPVPPGYQYPQQYIQQPQAYPYQQPQQHPYFGVQAPIVAPQVEMMPRNWFGVPQVLAQHEPREERPAAAFVVEVLRGMGMITGLISADFFSNIKLLRKPGE